MEFFHEVFRFWFFLSKKSIRVKKPKKPASNLVSQPPTFTLVREFYSLFWKKEKKREKPQTKTRKTSPKQYSVLVPVDLLRILSLPFARPGKTSVYEKQNLCHGTVGPPCPFFVENTRLQVLSHFSCLRSLR